MRVAFVVQRCGREVNGGAESLCLQIAQRLSAHCQIEVITTCAVDYVTWENWYTAGLEKVDGAVVRRFPVDYPRKPSEFDRLSTELRAKGARATLSEQENWMRAQGPISSALFEYLRSHNKEYDAFIFFGYLYATTYFGLPIVCNKAFLAPLAHDEWPIHLTMWDQFMTSPRQIIFNTAEEKEFFRRRFPGCGEDGPVIGIGIDPPASTDVPSFRAKYRLTDPYLLYVGRIDESKGCGELVGWFVRLRELCPEPLKLVLIGREVMSIPYHEDIIHLGFVAEKEKWDALAGCDWLVNPSMYESLSIALLESWAVARPGLVNAKSDVLVGHCRRSNGGLWYAGFEEWASALTIFEESTKSAMGEHGRQYVLQNYSWKRVEQSYLNLLACASAPGREPGPSFA